MWSARTVPVLRRAASFCPARVAAAWALVVLASIGVSGSKPPVLQDSPAVQVLTFYPGMSAFTTEKTITIHIERWVNQAPKVRRVESRSISGVSIVTVYFDKDADPTQALTLTNSLALATLPTLPPETQPPAVLPFDLAGTVPLGILTVGNPSLDEARLKDMVRIDVRTLLGTVPGCVAPVVVGGKDRTVLIYLDPKKLEARGLSVLDVIRAVWRGNLVVTPGTMYLYFGDNQVLLDTGVTADKVKQLNDLPVRKESGNTVYLRDIGRAEDGYAIPASRVRIDGRRGVFVPVFGRPGVSTGAAAADIRKRLPAAVEKLPKGTDLQFLEWGRGKGETRQAVPGLITVFVGVPSNLGLDACENRVAEVERLLGKAIPVEERVVIVSELGVNPDASAAATRNSSPQDATIRVQLSPGSKTAAAEYAVKLRRLVRQDPRFADLRIGFYADRYDASPPVRVRIKGGAAEGVLKLAREIRERAAHINGAADVFLAERPDLPFLRIEVDRHKAQEFGLSAQDVILQTAAALSASVWINRNFWIDFKSGNQYFVTIQYPENPAVKLQDVLDTMATGTKPPGKVKLGQLVTLHRRLGPAEIHHVNLTRILDIAVSTENRDVGGVAADLSKLLKELNVPNGISIDVITEPSNKE